MLFTLLTAMTSLMFVVGAILAAKHAMIGLGGYVLAIIIGSSLAICNAWMFYKLGDILADLSNSYSETRQGWIGSAFILFALLWLVGAAIIGNLVTSAAMRLFV